MYSTGSSSSHLTRGYSAALLSAVILSTTAIFIRYLTQTYQLPSLILAFWRDCFVVFSLGVILLLFRPALLRVKKDYLPLLIVFGLILALFNSFWTLSVAFNGAAVSTVLAYSSAAFTALLGWWFLRERMDGIKLLVVVISISGCVLVSGAYQANVWTSNLTGILTGALSGLLYAVYSLMGRVASQRGINTWTTLFYTFAFAAVFLFFFNTLSGGRLPGSAAGMADFLWLGRAWEGWLVLFLLAAGPTLAGFGAYNVALSHLPSSIANLIVTLEPAFTAVLAYLFLAERLTGIQILGSLVIIAGVVLLRLSEGRWMEGKTFLRWRAKKTENAS